MGCVRISTRKEGSASIYTRKEGVMDIATRKDGRMEIWTSMVCVISPRPYESFLVNEGKFLLIGGSPFQVLDV